MERESYISNKIIIEESQNILEPKVETQPEERENEKIPSILFHGSKRKFGIFRVKGKKPPESLRVQGRKCIYLHEDFEATKRKYSKEGGYIYEVAVKHAKNYGKAIEDEGLPEKSPALTSQVWIALPSDLKIMKRYKIETDGSETLEYERETAPKE